MNQKERAASCPKELVPVICNSEKIRTLKGVKKTVLCRNVVYVHPTMDKRYLSGTCALCDTQKLVKNAAN